MIRIEYNGEVVYEGPWWVLAVSLAIGAMMGGLIKAML